MIKQLILSVLITAFQLFSQTKAPLKNVTIFPSGAVLEHIIEINLKQGEQTVLFTGLASDVDLNSFMLEATNYTNVMSYRYIKDYQSKPSGDKTKKMEDKIKDYQKDVQKINNQIAIENQSIMLILDNKKLAGEQSNLDVKVLSTYLEYYKEQAKQVYNIIENLKEQQVTYNDSINILRKQISALQENPMKNTGSLEVVLIAENSNTTALKFSYYAPNASWVPTYDVLCEDISKPIIIKYKAHVTQNTGLDWEKVKLSLSTTQTNRSNTQPILQAWYLQIYQRYNQVGSDGDVMYNTVPSMESNKMKKDSKQIDMAQKIDMAVSFAFDITMPYDVLSDGKQHNVTIQNLEVPCTYKYYTVPKLDKDAFLLAEIADFEQYNFLPGEAQVFLEGKYTGKTLLDPLVTEATMNLSLGRDKSVVVKRERVKNTQSRNLLGSTRTDSYEYKISVKNNKNKAIDIIIKDQYPLTNNAQIGVEKLNHSKEGTFNEENGVVTWIENIASKDVKEVKISYKISRPKNLNIQGLTN